MTKTLRTADVADLALGAVFLATGGGGDPYVTRLATEQALRGVAGVDLIAADELADDARIVAIGGVGAPTVSLELLPSTDDPLRVLRAFESLVGYQVDALVSFEIGGANSLVPLIAAAGADIPVVDGDGMGRALPEAQMMTYAIGGVSPTPAVVLDYAGNVATLSTSDTPTYERHLRQLSLAMGGMVLTAEHPMRGAQLKQAIIPDTLSFSIQLGRVLREQRASVPILFGALRSLFGHSIYGDLHHLYSGKVTDYSSRIIGGFDLGDVTIEGFVQPCPALKVAIKNEYLVASLGDQVVASVPDLIILVDYETGTPINAERLRYGQRVSVLAVGCPEFYRQAIALQVVAPRAFGFELDYVPVERLSQWHQPLTA